MTERALNTCIIVVRLITSPAIGVRLFPGVGIGPTPAAAIVPAKSVVRRRELVRRVLLCFVPVLELQCHEHGIIETGVALRPVLVMVANSEVGEAAADVRETADVGERSALDIKPRLLQCGTPCIVVIVVVQHRIHASPIELESPVVLATRLEVLRCGATAFLAIAQQDIELQAHCGQQVEQHPYAKPVIQLDAVDDR